jgi:beta-glucosidase
LKVKQTLGILQYSTSIYPNIEDLRIIGSDESEDVSLEAAKESIVLAKNENDILPLNKNANILVVGPSADLLKALNGGWSYKWQGSNETYFQTFSGRNYKTILKAIQSKSTGVVSYFQGANFESLTTINEAATAAINSQYIVLCIGEDTYTETPGNIDNMMLSEPQMQLANRLLDTGKPVIIVYVGGRPRTITSIVKRSKAVLIAFLPGNRGGDALSDILFGVCIKYNIHLLKLAKSPFKIRIIIQMEKCR